MKSKPICFVIMGFGKKTDLESGKTLDLDKTYINVIKPAAIHAGFDVIRADEIADSGLIDSSMYALLLRADLVVADISTYNPNAIYELGVRHAAKPFSTIIIRDQSGRIPFDLDHTRIFHYEHLGEDIGVAEANRCVSELSALMSAVREQAKTDSPLYEHLRDTTPPSISDDEFNRILGKLAQRENNIFAKRAAALDDMANGRLTAATEKWLKAAEISDNDPYFVQQAALAKYKSKDPSPVLALTKALVIINRLEPDHSNDPETLGITGAIHKNIFLETGDLKSLDRAAEYYKRGFVVVGDYHTGENYANCLDLRFDNETNADEKTYLMLEARKTRKAIVEKLEQMDPAAIETRTDALWIYASLANCWRGLGDAAKSDAYEEKFLAKGPVGWQVETFSKTKKAILERNESPS